MFASPHDYEHCTSERCASAGEFSDDECNARYGKPNTAAPIQCLKLSHEDLSHYNAIQKVLYVGIIFTGVVIVASGLSIWKPVQFQEITAFFGGYNTARYVHFAAMTAIVVFLVVHVILALIAPKSLRAMIIGR